MRKKKNKNNNKKKKKQRREGPAGGIRTRWTRSQTPVPVHVSEVEPPGGG